MGTTTLEQRIVKLEAIEAIRSLKMTYAGYCDDGYSPDKIGPLFADDAIWDGGEDHFGVYRGRAEIEEFFGRVSAEVIFAMHYMIGGSIEVADDAMTATGSWYLWEPVTQVLRDEPASVWIMGTYNDRYVFDGGTWKFQHVQINFESIARADEGWHRDRFIQ